MSLPFFVVKISHIMFYMVVVDGRKAALTYGSTYDKID